MRGAYGASRERCACRAVGCGHEPEAGRGTRRAGRPRRRVRLRAEQAGRRLAHRHRARRRAAGGVPDRSPRPRSRARRSPASRSRSRSLQGKPVFINFWGSWCAPCRREAPQLRAFSRTLGGRAAFVGVAYQSPHAEGRRRSRARPAGAIRSSSAACCDLGDRYGVVAMPTTIVVDSKGQVVDRLIGPQTAARLTAELRALGA